MKKIVTYIVFFCILFAGCINEQIDDCVSSVIIRGNQIQGAGRAAEEITRFQSGSVISFFSQGGIEADNVYLTYANGIWEHGGALSWNELGKEASFTAFYPCFESGDWKYYDENGFLKDIVYAQGEVSSGRFIELSFRHLFSKIIFEVDEALNEQIQSITFTPSVQVESVQPLTGGVVLTGTSANPFQIEKQSNRMYSFFVPSANEVTIDIQITASEGKQLSLVTTSPQFYQSGYQYTYRLAPEVHEPGIYTVEDFIAFSHLINGMEYEGYTLDDFGYMVDGVMTYFLCADIEFTEGQSEQVQPIGCSAIKSEQVRPFNACFDGQGHTLSDLQLITPENTIYQGLFGYVGELGMVKNLTLENCSYTNPMISNRTYFEGMIVGKNEGIVTGCHVKSCNITDQKSNRAGSIVGENKGTIVNCSAYNVSFKGNLNAGGICYYNSKQVINCYSHVCNFNCSHAGGLFYDCALNNFLLNSYVYNLIGSDVVQLGELSYNATVNTVFQYCYYPISDTSDLVYKNFTNIKDKSTIYTYDTDFTVADTGETLLDALNAWVDKNQGKYTFTLQHWETGPEGNPVLVP